MTILRLIDDGEVVDAVVEPRLAPKSRSRKPLSPPLLDETFPLPTVLDGGTVAGGVVVEEGGGGDEGVLTPSETLLWTLRPAPSLQMSV